jgi:hypothetical protein
MGKVDTGRADCKQCGTLDRKFAEQISLRTGLGPRNRQLDEMRRAVDEKPNFLDLRSRNISFLDVIRSENAANPNWSLDKLAVPEGQGRDNLIGL